MKKKVFTILFFLIFISSCKYIRGDNCNNTLTIVGKYENVYDKEAKNILIIKKNGTFEQVFTKGDLIKTNNGTWKFFQESCNVYLTNLKLLHKLPQKLEDDFFRESGIHRLNNIVFVEGLSSEFNYYRINE